MDGLEQLEGGKAPADLVAADGWRDLPLDQRMKRSAEWAEWAPGFKAALCEGLQRHLQKMMWKAGEISDDQSSMTPRLCPITQAAMNKWKLHIENDHQPMRRDCRTCVEAAGRSRPHRRITHPSAYCLSLDLSGRLKKGKDQFSESHKYFMTACYTFPTTKDDLPLTGPACSGDAEDVPLPALDEVVQEDGLDADLEDFELPQIEDDDGRAADLEDGDDRAHETAKSSHGNWMKLVEHCQDVKVKTLTFVELLPSRNKQHVLEAIAKVYAKIRSLGLEVLRLHADRAREFTSKVVQAWCYERGIAPTFTSGSDWKANGRAENEIGIVKRHAKVLMKAHDVSEQHWPLLVRHAAERRLRWQLRQVGFPVPELLPLRTKVLVKRKSWNSRYTAWRWDRTEGYVMGPDPWSSLTSGGYCAQLTDGKFMAATDVVAQHPGMNPDEIVRMVVEKSQDPEPEPQDPVPRRRLRGKQTVASMAKLELGSNSGETVPQGEEDEKILRMQEQDRLLRWHQDTTKVLSEECRLIDDMDVNHAALIPSLAMLAHQKMEIENHLTALDVEDRRDEQEENFLVTKTVSTDQVYREWSDWQEAMRNEYNSIVEEKRAVRQVKRLHAQKEASERGVKYEELPSKVVFTRKAGGKRKVRACICGNFEDDIASETYAGGCDASQIRGVVRHAALSGWKLYGTDIRCAFLNAKRKDTTKVITMTIPQIYVKMGLATPQDVWVVDGAMYGLATSPKDWGDHRDVTIPNLTWRREVPQVTNEAAPGDAVSVKGGGDGSTCLMTAVNGSCQSPDRPPATSETWIGSFVQAKDQHVWHLQEECFETGQKVKRGLMAIYVDDVLLAADEMTAESALTAIGQEWECAKPVQATVSQPVTFCGFEIQENEEKHGGGFRLHQKSYEEDLLAKWNVTRSANQLNFKLPMPEDEANMERSQDAEMVRKAQASTGALLWLATRTRPELSVGVAAMSRLCTKDPAETLAIGGKIMEYLRRPTLGLIYGSTPGPIHGVRNQLQKPRCVRTVEAFSDISYASTQGYRSVQGQVYYYAGAPIMWNTNRQPFPTQSTAESELISLCEALVGGLATASLVAALRDEDEEMLKKRIWGDNSAAISLATGSGQGSWRTRHLRIRAAILKSALSRGEWELNHLSGKELVADSFTKIVDGLAFERALQDLGIQTDKTGQPVEVHGGADHYKAKLAMMIGSTLITSASAAGDVDQNEDLTGLWTCGLILMCVGAVYVGHLMLQGGRWLKSRLLGTSGGYVEPLTQGLGVDGRVPQLKALRISEDDGEWEVCSEVSQRSVEDSPRRTSRADTAERVRMEDLQEMMQQQHAAVRDPYNKIHGRAPSPWIDDEDDRSHLVDRAMAESLPTRRRRKKKGGNRSGGGDLEAEAEQAFSNLYVSMRNLFGKSSTSRTPSGLAASGSSSRNPLPPSGLAGVSSSSQSPLPPSGSASVSSSSRNPLPQSGSAGESSTSKNPLRKSGLAGENSMSRNSMPRSGLQTSSAASGSEALHAGTAKPEKIAAESAKSPPSSNRWNQFQAAHKGKHWGTEKMRAEYYKYMATGKMPWACEFCNEDLIFPSEKGGVQRVQHI